MRMPMSALISTLPFSAAGCISGKKPGVEYHACARNVFCGECSKHEAAGLHAAARAVSGASVYVSDKPGQHDFGILKQLVLSDGSVLRGLLPGRPTLDCLFLDPLRDNRSLLKVCHAFAALCDVFLCEAFVHTLGLHSYCSVVCMPQKYSCVLEVAIAASCGIHSSRMFPILFSVQSH